MEIPTNIKKTYSRIQVLDQQVGGISRRIGIEKQNIENYKSRIAKLDGLAAESLSGSSKSYEKYKTSVKKLNEQLSLSLEILEKLQQVRRPLLEELRTHKYNLQIILPNFIIEFRRKADSELSPLLDTLMDRIENFLSDCKEICRGFGILFIERGHFIPLGLPADFLADYRRKKAAEKPIHETENIESTQTTAPDSPQAPSPEQQDVVTEPSMPSEGIEVPPEPVSQAVEAESAVNDVVGETPEPA